jgi:hypothetical protein
MGRRNPKKFTLKRLKSPAKMPIALRNCRNADRSSGSRRADMSITGIPSSVFLPALQNLGQNLPSENSIAGQAGLVTPQQESPVTLTPTFSSSSSASDSVTAQTFRQLAQDLQSQRLSGTAQKGIDGTGQDLGTEISQLFTQLGQELQAGNLLPAQRTFLALEQSLQQLGENTDLAAPVDAPTTHVSLSA